MKRLLIVATLAIMAAGCQKTFVQNEVQTPIGFSTEVGKQTRAIVDGNTYLTTQPFAVYAYGHQTETNSTNTIMNNVEIFYDDQNNDQNDHKWRANDGLTYYWPNDPRTTINFYAYSPSYSVGASATNNHQKLNGGISHNENDGLSLTGYTHSNMYVDFMVGTPVLKATYSNPDGNDNTATTSGKEGEVPVNFHHQMTQIVFNVKTDKAYSGVTFTVKSITFNKVNSHANFVQDYDDDYGVWSSSTPISYSNVFPALAANGATDETAMEVDNTAAHTLKTTPVTMIPQGLTNTDKTTSDEIITDGGQSFTIEYSISGTGVATETVVKTFEFADATSAPAWEPNKKITYTLTIGLNEITFAPTVMNWDDSTNGSYDIDDNN